MNPLTTFLAAAIVAAGGSPALAASPTPPESGAAALHATDISAQTRKDARRRAEPAQPYQPRAYRGFADPSIGPDGRPYRVPEYLRNQCYIDEGYGRFSSCSNRT